MHLLSPPNQEDFEKACFLRELPRSDGHHSREAQHTRLPSLSALGTHPMGWRGATLGGLTSSWVGWVPAAEPALLGPSAASLSHTVFKERVPEHTEGQNVFYPSQNRR